MPSQRKKVAKNVGEPSSAPQPLAQPSTVGTPPSESEGEVMGERRPMTEDEIARYDRQIRLWGVKAQEKIRAANVLLITMRGLGNEVAKNLVLAGIGSLTIVDDGLVSENDLTAQFLLAAAPASAPATSSSSSASTAQASHILGANRADASSHMLRQMNARVAVHVVPNNIKTMSASFYRGFDLIIATDLDPQTFDVVNTATRLAGKPFYAAGTYGFYGFIFVDLIEHDYIVVRDRSNIPPRPNVQESETRSVLKVEIRPAPPGSGDKDKESITKREQYSTWMISSDMAPLPQYYKQSPRRLRNVTPALPCLRALWTYQRLFQATPDQIPRVDAPQSYDRFTQLVDTKQHALGIPVVPREYIQKFSESVGGYEISPVVTAVGGQLAQDVINVLGHTQQPIQNLVVFDGIRTQALTYALHPAGPLGRSLLQTTSATPESAKQFLEKAEAVMNAAVLQGPAFSGALSTGAPAPGPMVVPVPVPVPVPEPALASAPASALSNPPGPVFPQATLPLGTPSQLPYGTGNPAVQASQGNQGNQGSGAAGPAGGSLKRKRAENKK